jgi:hypothetical protein
VEWGLYLVRWMLGAEHVNVTVAGDSTIPHLQRDLTLLRLVFLLGAWSPRLTQFWTCLVAAFDLFQVPNSRLDISSQITTCRPISRH